MKLRSLVLSSIAFLAIAPQIALAITPLTLPVGNSFYPAPVISVQRMEEDSDSFTPTSNDPLNDPNLGGLPPGAPPGDPGGYPEFLPGEDWLEHRTSEGAGIIEEVPTGFQGVASADGPNFAIVQFEDGNGPFGRQGRQNGIVGAQYYAQTHIYIDPTRPYGGPDGLADFWWANGISNNDGSGFLTEADMLATVDPGGATWSIRTNTNNVLLAVVPTGIWTMWEVQPKQGPGNTVLFEYRVWNTNRTALLGSATLQDFAFSSWSDVGGPRFTWFTSNGPNMPYLYVDDVGWRPLVPEPSTWALGIAAGVALTLVGVRRRARYAR